MIHSHQSLFTLIFGIAIFASSTGYAPAQQVNGPPENEQIALREKAFQLLASVAAQLNTLQSVENRARMGSNIVGSLWKHDEERARSLLRAVQEDIRTELQKRDRPVSDDTTLDVFLKLRHDTVERIAKHDGEAALDFLKATEPVFEERPPRDFVENEQALLLRLAKQMAADNADTALKLGRQTLERGFPSDLLIVLARLNRTHKQQGQILYKEIVEKLRDADVLDNWNNRYFAQALVGSFQPPDADESVYRELVGIFVTKALANGCGNKLSNEDGRANFCRWVGSITRQSERYDSRVARLKVWDAGGDNSRNLGLHFQEIDDLFQENAFEQLEAIANKNPEVRDVVHHRLIYQAVSANDFDRARKMIDRMITNPERQRQLHAEVEKRANRFAANDEKLAEIQRRVEELPTDHGRALFLLVRANELGAADPKIALKLLNQAAEIIDAMKPGKEQTRTQIGLAIMYCFEKNDRGFAIMESVVPKLNELVEVAVKLDGYDTNYLRDGEWNMSANGGIGGLLTQLSQQAGPFAWCDFDRAVTLASQFQRPEIRMMAHLKLAQAILAGPPKRFAGY